VIWGFPGGGYCCPECGVPFTLLGGHVIEQLDWEVTVRLVAHCRRQYRRARRCLAPATVTAPGPPKAIGKGLVTNGFIALLFTERYVAGRSQNSLIAGLSRHGADISPAKLAGTCAAAGSLLAPPEERSSPGPGTPGTCMPTRRPGTCSPPARQAGRKPSTPCRCLLTSDSW